MKLNVMLPINLFCLCHLMYLMVAKATLTIVVIPSILAFAFAAWVYYNIVIDVSGRPLPGGIRAITKCAEGCESGNILNAPSPTTPPFGTK